MAHNWAAVHARKLAAYQRFNPTGLTFSETTSGTHEEATETFSGSPATASVAGYGVRSPKGDPIVYADLGLKESEAPTIDFVPTTMGQTPSDGMSCMFGGESYTVKNVAPFAPAGQTISARVVVVRG